MIITELTAIHDNPDLMVLSLFVVILRRFLIPLKETEVFRDWFTNINGNLIDVCLYKL